MKTTASLRMCVVCRTRRAQGMLVRVVRTAEGALCLDEGRHRREGRGAYLCAEAPCLAQAERRRVFKRVLGGIEAETLYEDVRRSAEARSRHN